MIRIILIGGILLLVIALAMFLYCSLVIASREDDCMENLLRQRNGNENE